MNHSQFLLTVLTLVALLNSARGDTSNEQRRYKALKFGETDQDYVMYQPDMQPLESAFTVCAWVKKLLRDAHAPMWFSYAVTAQAYEITITDSGTHTRIFGDTSDLTSLYTVSQGTWFHNCLSWSAASQTRNVYINGVLVDGKGTPAGRNLGQDGYLVIGNQQGSPGSGMDNNHKFAGELYKLNVFSKMLSTSEIQEMAKDICSDVEETYSATRHIRWEDVIQVSRNGNVYEKTSECLSTAYTRLQNKLEQTQDKLNDTLGELTTAKVEMEKTAGKLNETLDGLAAAKAELEKTATKLNQTLTKIKELEKEINNSTSDCPLNSTVTSHWDFLYSDTFYGETLTTDRLEVLRNSLEKLEYFVGVRVTDGIIQFLKLFYTENDCSCEN